MDTPAETGTPEPPLIARHFPGVQFHDEIGRLLSEMLARLDATRSMDRDVQIEAYEEIVARTVEILRWINRNTLIRPTDRDPVQLTALLAEKAALEEKLQRLLEKAADLKKEVHDTRKALKASAAGRRELAALLLGIAPDADAATVKTAYREKVKRAHPDTGGDADFFKAVTEAMLILLPRDGRKG